MRTKEQINLIKTLFIEVQDLAPNASLASIGKRVGLNRTYLHALRNGSRPRILPGGDRKLADYYQQYVESGSLTLATELAQKVSDLERAVKA